MTTLLPACMAKLLVLAAAIALGVGGLGAVPLHGGLGSTLAQWFGRWLIASLATGLLFGQFALGEE